MNDQIQEIEKHKWIESEKAGKDLGDSAIMDWIQKYAKIFRTQWELSHSGEIENANYPRSC